MNQTSIKSGICIGIDLGTTNSLAAFVQDSPHGRIPTLIQTSDSSHSIPSVVHYNGQQFMIGETARAQKNKPDAHLNTASSFKRLMGYTYEEICSLSDPYPYTLVKNTTPVRVQLGDRELTAVELSALVLGRLKRAAEHQLNASVTQAVITVPAYFNDAQRQATRAAGRLAGLDVLRILNEPTAAALSFGLERKNAGCIAVYDFGGGTFDVSILKLHDGIFEVLAAHGDTRLGGDDIDRALALDFSTKNKVPFDHHLNELLHEAERVKIELSTHERCDFQFNGIEQTYSVNDLKQLSTPLVERSLLSCAKALNDAGITANKLTDVLLVGGTTRLPFIQEAVSAFFERPVYTSDNPEERVAIGAAIQADILAGNNIEFLLLDVIPLTLGIETYGGVMSPLLSRNTRIPAVVRDQFTTYADYQTGVDIHVLQGERERIEDNRSLARFKFKVAPMKAGIARIEVTFLVDADGILQVTAKDLLTSTEQTVEIQQASGLSESEIERMLIESARYVDQDRQLHDWIELKNHAEPILRQAEENIEEAARRLPPLEFENLENQIAALRIALRKQNPAIAPILQSIESCLIRMAELRLEQKTKPESFTVRLLTPNCTSIDNAPAMNIHPEETLFQAATRAGVHLPHGCGELGVCGGCHVQVIEGADQLVPASEQELDTLESSHEITLKSRLACLARLATDR